MKKLTFEGIDPSKYLKYRCFSDCHSLEQLKIPGGFVSNDSFAFANFFNLQSLVIPKTTTTINDKAFEFCSSLKSCIFLGTKAPTFSRALFENGILKKVNATSKFRESTFCDIPIVYSPSKESFESFTPNQQFTASNLLTMSSTLELRKEKLNKVSQMIGFSISSIFTFSKTDLFSSYDHPLSSFSSSVDFFSVHESELDSMNLRTSSFT